jgi:methylated-DNA-[protein]-cysteine S-methyltransferase
MVRQFIDYLDGTSVGPSEVNIDYGKITGFQAAVLSAARRVPYGSTCTYSELALMAGFPKAIRAVASVMRNNRVPLLVPCHRIVKKDGSTGAYCGDRNGADALLKKTLLQLERGQLKKCRCLSSFSCS